MQNSEITREDALGILEMEYGFQENDIYLLELIPLIEMIWADGKNQAAEISLLYRFVIKHMAELSKHALGQEVVSVDQVNAFLDRFVHQRPDPKLLRDLRGFTLALSFCHSDEARNQRRKRRILEYCMDIAAAAVPQYPYEVHDRIVAEEKQLLIELMHAFDIAPDRPAPD